VPFFVCARLYEEFNLHLLELTGAECEVSGGDLVAEGFANLADAEGWALSGGCDDVLEVDEDTLCGLRAEVDLRGCVLDGAEEGFEHEVEVASFGNLAAAVGTGFGVDVIGAEAVVAGLALDEWVAEGPRVARGDPDLWVHEDGGLQAYHVVAVLDEAMPPGVADVAFELDAEGAVVVGGGEAAINFAGLEYESPALAEGDDFVHFNAV